MVYSPSTLFLALLTASTTFANPISTAPPTHPLAPGALALAAESRRILCQGEECGPTVVVAASTSSTPSATTCTTPTVVIPVGCTEETSGPYAGQCVEFICFEYPDTCGCPGAPPEPAPEKRNVASSDYALDGPCTVYTGPPQISDICFDEGDFCVSIQCHKDPNTCGCPYAQPAAGKEKRTVNPGGPITSSTSTVANPSPTVCTEWVGAFPVGTECFVSGPQAGQCISFACLEHPNTCGCPGAPPIAPALEERTTICFENGTCTTFECLEIPHSPACLAQKEKRAALPIPSGPICPDFGDETCAEIECSDFLDSPGCEREKERRSEGEHIKRGDSLLFPAHGGHGPVCVEPVCKSCPYLLECASDVKQSP